MDMPVAKPGHAAPRLGRDPLPNQVYQVTVVTRSRQRYFEPFAAACTAARAFTDRRSLGDSKLLAWVLMPDHAHWLLQIGARDPLPVVIGRMKARSARAVNRLRGEKRPVWASAYHDHALRTEEDIAGVARYIVANPLRAGLVKTVADYPFWDAMWLA
jgi:REP element-mobilizing transposase RayT